MPSPFPGMDPWLEGEEVFPNLHERLIISMQDALNAALPPGYVATSKNRVWVDPELRREPDVALFSRDPHAGNGNGGTAVALAGLTALGQRLTSDPIEEPYLEILSAKGKRLVTAFEVVSLSNKRAGEQGRKTYQDKQKEYALSGVHLVEIDLLRRGPHVTATPLHRLRRAFGEFDYHVSAVVAGADPFHHAAGIKLTDRLPAIGIPLDAGVAPITVDLQPMLDLAYDRGRYTELFSYRDPPDPPLTPAQQAWAEGVLRAKGLLTLGATTEGANVRIDELRTLLKARPFRPFTVYTPDGTPIPVWHPDFALLSPDGRTLWVYQSNYACDMLDVMLIPRFSLAAPDPAPPSEDAPQPGAA